MSLDGLSAGVCVVVGGSAVELGGWPDGDAGAAWVEEVERRSRAAGEGAERALSPGTVNSGRGGAILGELSSSAPQALAWAASTLTKTVTASARGSALRKASLPLDGRQAPAAVRAVVEVARH